jgi:hypothetical protein
MGDVLFKKRGCDPVYIGDGDEMPSIENASGTQDGMMGSQRCGQCAIVDATDGWNRRERFFLTRKEKGIFIQDAAGRAGCWSVVRGWVAAQPKCWLETIAGACQRKKL